LGVGLAGSRFSRCRRSNLALTGSIMVSGLMRTLKLVVGLMLSGALMIGGPAAQALTITLDENGNAIGTVGQGSFVLDLVYQLPFHPPGGFIFVRDSISLTAPLEDVLDFADNGILGFFSVNTDGVDSLADQGQGFLVPIRANIVEVLEVGTEGSNGF